MTTLSQELSTMARTATQVRQGDVLVQRVRSLPSGAVRRPATPTLVLAEGEATGHAHAIDGRHGALYDAPAGEVFVELDQVSQLLHEEHAAIDLEPGVYRVIRQREYAPDEIRNVAD